MSDARTGIVRPFILRFLANALRYVSIQSCNVRRHFRYGNAENYNTGIVISIQDVSSGMVIKKITVPVL
jgi:hypothetical protein